MTAAAWTGRWQDGLRYGGLGFPLAFVALPLYVVLPNHYAVEYGVPLAWLGLLLGARLLDAVADPLIGRWADTLLGRPRGHAAWVTAAIASVVLALGFRGLFFPPGGLGPLALMGWCAVLLTVTYLAYSVIGIVHQAWGARLGGDEAQRARIVAWRESLALAGVLVASVLPSAAGLSATTLVFAIALAAAIALLRFAPRTRPVAEGTRAAPTNPFRTPAFRGLLGVYLLNGIASAIPATLVLFFIRDRLQAPAHEALFLGSYFAAAALSIPGWLRAVARRGLVRTWRVAMLLSIAVFGWAAALGAGDVAAYTAVCLLSGVALGADLILPGALLAGVIQAAGHGGQAEGAYVGWWNFATKLNLALAAGLSLPLLQAFGYAPGARGEPALTALVAAYCLLPCILKLTAAVLIGRFHHRHPDTTRPSP
jgi:GPH family glycoside/pentoside/hexuronide:cation symporter